MKVIFILSILLTGISPSLAAPPQPRTVQAIIGTIEVAGTRWIQEEVLKKVLPFREGEIWRPDLLSRAEDHLKKWGRFSHVQVTARPPTEGRVAIRVEVTEAPLISSVDFKGTYPFLARRLKRLISLRPGMVYRSEMLAPARERLSDFYEKAGFTGTQITVDLKGDPQSPWVIPQFKISRGHRFRIGTIAFEGSRILPDRYLKNKINTYLLYSPKRLKSNLASIKEAYAKRGHAAARVHLRERTFDTVKRKVHLRIGIHEGKRVNVKVLGTRKVSAQKIRKALTVLKEGYWDPHEIKASTEAVQKLYRHSGFLEARVDIQKVREDAASVDLTAAVTEGPRSVISRLEIVGNETMPARRIKKVLETHTDTLFSRGLLDQDTLEADRRRIAEFYQSAGFPDIQVGSPEVSVDRRSRTTIIIPVIEGPRVSVGDVHFKGLGAALEKKGRRLLKWGEGRPFNPVGIERDKERLLVMLASQGHPHALARVTPQIEGSKASLTYEVEEGLEVRLGDILIVGNQTTRDKAIKKSLSLKEGAPFSYKKLLDSQAGLRRMGAFNTASIEMIGLKDASPTVLPLVRVEENPPIVLSLKGSYNTDNNFTGIVSLTDRNLFRQAKRGVLQLTGGNDIARAEANIIDSRLFGIALEGIAGGFAEFRRRPSFNYTRYGTSVSFVRDFTPEITTLAKYELARTTITTSISGTDPSTELARDLTTPKATFSASYDSRDSFADPRRGIHTLINSEFFNEVFGAGANFIRVSGGASHYFSLANRWTFFSTARVAGIQRYVSSTVIPGQERLYLGGDYTIRGFDEDALVPTGGNVSVLASAEFQTRLGSNFKGILFSDNGSLTGAFRDISTRTLRHSAGVGLHYVTPIGPIRLDWAFKLDQKSGEDLWRIHFIFGYAF